MTYRRNILSALMILNLLYVPVSHADPRPSPPQINAASWLAIDGTSGAVVAEHNPDEEREPASLTKIMTAYVVLKAIHSGQLSWDEKIIVKSSDIVSVQEDESRMYLVPGQAIKVRELVTGLIVASANDAALVLARRVGGTIPHFTQIMTSTAHQIGMNRSHFVTPSGVTTPDHYSTAHDLARLAVRLTTDFPEYYQFSQQKVFKYGTFSKQNKNKLLRMDSTVDGLKTGHTEAAGWCIIATASRSVGSRKGSSRVFAVVLGAATEKDRIEGAHKLIEESFTYSFHSS